MTAGNPSSPVVRKVRSALLSLCSVSVQQNSQGKGGPPPPILTNEWTVRSGSLEGKRTAVNIAEYGRCRLWRDALGLFDDAQDHQRELNETHTRTWTYTGSESLLAYSAAVSACGKGQ